jgi:RHS repeat-associated protein
VRRVSRLVKRVLVGTAVPGSSLLLVASMLGAVTPAEAAVTASSAPAGSSPAPLASADSALAAAAAAHRQGSRVEILGDRTDYSQVFANPDGTQTYVASWSPVWVKQGTSWARPDATLSRNPDGSLSPAASVNGLALSGGGNQALATTTAGGKSLAVSWPSALPAPSVSGATATYAGVFPGVDLVVTADAAGGFDETLVIKNQAAAADPQLADLNLGVQASSGLAATAGVGAETWGKPGGSPVFTSPAPLAWDSAGGGSGVSGPGQGADVAAAGASYGGGKVRLSVPQGLLNAPASSFPVYLDPSFQVTSGVQAYAMAASGTPTTAYWDQVPAGNGLGAGYHNSTNKIERTFYQLAVPAAVAGSTVLSASLAGTVSHAGSSSSTSHTVNLYSAGAISSSTTWNTMPAHSASAWASATFTTTSATPALGVSWDVTSMMQNVANNGSSSTVIELVNSAEASTATASWVGFTGVETLTVTYDDPPLAPSATSMTPESWATDGNAYTSSSTPSFTATATSPVGASVSYVFEILDSSGSTVIASGNSGPVPLTSGTPGSWQDATPLTNGTSYLYKVQAFDGTANGPWSTAQPFTVQTDTPAAVTVTCTGYPSGTWSAQISSSTCSWSAPLSHMNGYAYSLDGTWSWTSGTSVTISPGPGMHTLSVVPQSAGGLWGPQKNYTFGVGVTGAMLTPADASQTSATIQLQAAAPPGYTTARFQYRYGTTGDFADIPQATVFSCGCAVTWPVSTTTNAAGVQTALLSWYVTRVLPDDGPLQIQAVFYNSSGGTDTTPPVTVTLDRVGTGADYATTSAGPVTVGLQSGNAAVSATDVSIASYGADLAVTRTFNSLEPYTPSIFGPGWASSLTGGVTTAWTQLTTSSGNYAVLHAADGTSASFLQGSTTGGITSWTPQGAAVTSRLTLTQNTSANTFTLIDSSGTVTVFEQANSAAGYVPRTVTRPGDASSAGFVYDPSTTDGTYGDPLLMVAPDPASTLAPTTACPYPVSASTWTVGCRGLLFSYNASHRVSQISFVYVDNGGTFHSVPVADYGYDTAGELTSEWDPRLAVPLVTGYTYDETASDPDYGRITQITSVQAAGSGAYAPWTLTYDDTSTDVNYGHLLTVSRTHAAAYGGGTATTTIGYSVPLTTNAGGPINMDAATVGAWGETDVPFSAVAVFPPNRVPSSPPTATDYQYAQIDYYDANGRQVNTTRYINGAWAVATTQYDAYGNTVSTLSAADRATAEASANPAGTALELSTVNVYGCDNSGTVGACTSSDRQYQVLTDSYGPAHNASVDGTVELIRTHTAYGYDNGAPNSDTTAAGTPYMSVTSETVSASIGDGIPGSATADARTTTYTYGNSTTSIGWTLGQPLTTITDPNGLHLVATSVFNTSTSLYNGANLQTGSYKPSDTNGGGAGDTETVYYTAGTNSVVAACGNKPEWANLTCQTGSAAQPGTSGLPNLPVTTYTYDDYLNVVTKTETFGSTGTRTTTTGYDSDERPSTQAITVTGTGIGTAIPETKTVYSANSGLVTDNQTLNSSGSVTADISTGYDDFGNPLSYTDAAGNTTSYTYDLADRVTSRNDGKGTLSYSYSPDGQLTSENDSQTGSFSATYDPDGSVATETYPGGLTGTYTYDATATPTSLSYSGASWTAPLTDSVVPNAAGDWASQAVTDTAVPLIGSQAYSYDNADRLTSVQDTEAGQCTTRGYGYDADSNRTSLTSYAPGTGGACQTGSGTTTSWAYDSADRTASTGYAYGTQGDITTTPSADAGGTGDLTAAYYANGMLASQTQNGATMTWALDPTQARFSSYTQGGVTYTNHYSDTGNSPAWVSASNGGWTRYVTDVNGMLAVQVTASGTTLELPDLHGNIVATATASSTATGPTATYIYTEFGAAESGTPGAYGWLGGDQISGGALGTQLLMGARSYNTNTGRFSQVDPIPGGSANAYDYAFQNPLVNFDLSGKCGWWSGCQETAYAGASIAGAACYAFLSWTVNLCWALAGGAYNLVAYLWDSSHPTWWGAISAFASGFFTWYVTGAFISGTLMVLSRVFGWWGASAASSAAAQGARAAIKIGRHAKMSVWSWLMHIW